LTSIIPYIHYVRIARYVKRREALSPHNTENHGDVRAEEGKTVGLRWLNKEIK